MSELHKELSRIEFEMRENSMTHTPVENEMRFYEAVKRGDMDAARTLSTPLGGEGFGVLSTDRLRNLKYHLVITVSFITRFCVEGGMERETAYNLSDLYIRKADLASSQEEINAIHSELITDFTERMARLKYGSSYCYQVTKCMEYVYAACQMLKYSQYEAVDVGNFLAFSSHSHFIQKFREETGLTPKQYREKYYHSSSGMKAGVEIK